MITERFMQLGDWDLQLSPETPLSVRQLLQENDQIVVVPARIVANMDRADLLSNARWRGVIMERGDDGTALSGNGMLWFIGNANGDGPMMNRWTPTPTGWLGHLTLVSNDVAWNGLQTQFVSDAPTDTWPAAGGATDELSRVTRIRLEYLAAAIGAEYYVDAQGRFFSAAAGSSSIWQTTPRVILRRGHEGRDIDLIGLRIVEWGVTEDYWDATSGAKVGGDFSGTWFESTTIGPGPQGILYGAGGAQRGDNPGAYLRLETLSSEYDADSADQRMTYLGRYVTVEYQRVQVSVDTYDPGRWMKPGDYVWAFDPINRVYDEAQFTAYHGEHVNPAKLRLFGMSWPIREGMGVYRLSRSSADDVQVVDLTDYVVYDDGPCVLEVGAPNRSYNE